LSLHHTIPDSYGFNAPQDYDPGSGFLRSHVLEPLFKEGKLIILFMLSHGGVYVLQAIKGMSKKGRAVNGRKGSIFVAIFCAGVTAVRGTSALDAMGIEAHNFPDWLDYDVNIGKNGIWNLNAY